ncbi:diguanylate cyclase (GGDEF) domain-containing protein [Acidovorax soli]|uniref:diguanylate cyclase n=3 Tax=Comamonadaceae TaxID=80864 RepID=A0A1H3W0V2_9BURK|nr:diguanylate cyclase (GGDEF) domain-containing protein [Acidovorax soli]
MVRFFLHPFSGVFSAAVAHFMIAVPAAPTHWVVRMNHRNRSASWLIFAVVLAAHFLEHGHGAWTWWLMVLQFLVYPHVVYLRARHAEDPLAAEIQNLLLDNFCFGLWAAALGFPLWIAYTLVICGGINLTAFRALKGLLQALVAVAAGAALMVAVAGWRFTPDTSLRVSAMSMLCLSIYLVLFARDAHTRTVALSATRARLRKSEAALQSQLQAVESLQEQLTEQAHRDPLTGLHNRRYLNTALPREIDACAREGATLALLLLDLDHFKQINDRHGHAAGDDVLCQVAALLLQSMRPSDSCCRYGGEEFLLLLPGMGLQTAVERAQALRQQVAERRWLADGQSMQVTLSIGVACAQDAGLKPAALIDLADQALYRAKAEGRNRVCAAPAVPQALVDGVAMPVHPAA